jgi:hypothetical protein
MSAFAMVLAAGMAVGSGPEAVSSGVEQGLDLRGKWEGHLRSAWGKTLTARLEAQGAGCGGTLFLKAHGREEEGFRLDRVTDEGGGRLRLEREIALLGIYKWQGDQLVICFRMERAGRPTSFQAGDGKDLLILHRVKPGK